MCLSIGAPSVSIWKKAISNRKRTREYRYGLDGALGERRESDSEHPTHQCRPRLRLIGRHPLDGRGQQATSLQE